MTLYQQDLVKHFKQYSITICSSPEVASDVIFGAAIDNVGLDVDVKLGVLGQTVGVLGRTVLDLFDELTSLQTTSTTKRQDYVA